MSYEAWVGVPGHRVSPCATAVALGHLLGEFLGPGEYGAACGTDCTTSTGRRDHEQILPAARSRLRVSELTRLTVSDVRVGTEARAACVVSA